MWNCNITSLHYLGDKAFCDVVVGEARGLVQLAGERGVGLVKGLPTDPWRRRGQKRYSSRTKSFPFNLLHLLLYLFSGAQKHLKRFK